MRRIEQFHHPRSLDEAVRILAGAGGKAAVIAGGTEVVGRVPEPVNALVDITRLGLDRIEASAEGTRIGSCVTLQRIVDSDALRNYLDGVVREGALQSATRFIRNAATVGGNLVSTSPAWDLVAALLAADATVEVAGPEAPRSLPIDEFLARREDHLAPGHVVTAVTLPRFGQATHARMEKLARCAHDPPIVTAVVRWSREGNRLDDVRVVVGGLGDRPQRLALVEAALSGRAASLEEIERATVLVPDQVHPAPDVRGTAEYRAEMAAVMVRRALLGAIA
jgi:carbon-monoxide dehydrogenase medium subunit